MSLKSSIPAQYSKDRAKGIWFIIRSAVFAVIDQFMHLYMRWNSINSSCKPLIFIVLFRLLIKTIICSIALCGIPCLGLNRPYQITGHLSCLGKAVPQQHTPYQISSQAHPILGLCKLIDLTTKSRLHHNYFAKLIPAWLDAKLDGK